jgi:DMSO/TMAO reductase YedYZ molybdopterin-dependent catalytic subunit
VDLKTWRLKIEGLVEKPIALSLDEIKALPQKIQTRTFICVEGWGLDNQKWEGVHLKEIFAKVKVNSKAKFVTFVATGGQYRDSLSI